MKRDTTGKFIPHWDTEPKQQVCITLTATAWQCLGEAAQAQGVSRSEMIERFARNLGNGQALESDLEESEVRYRQLFEHNPQPMWIFDAETLAFLTVNQAAIQHYGYSKEEFLAMTIRDIRPPEDVPKLLHKLANTPASLDDAGIWTHRKKDGTLIDVKITTHEETFLGRPAWLILIQDVTEQRRTEMALRQSEENYRSMHDSLNVALDAAEMGTWDLDLIHDTARRSLRHDQIFGYDTLQPEWGHAIAKRHVLAEDQAKLDESFQQAFTTGELRLEVRIVWPDQSLHWINALGRVHYDEQGHPVRMAGVVMDITARKQAEAALRQSEERLRLALLVGKAGIWDWDILNDHITWSEQIYQFHGLVPGSFSGRVEDFAQLIHPDDQTRVSNAIRQALTEKTPYELEFRALHPDQTVRWLSTTGGVIFNEQGSPVRMLGATRDITERKAVEEERERLLLSEQRARTEAEAANRIKDEFLAVLSHELRSPLNPILGWSKLLQTRQFDPASQQRALETIERNAKLQTQLIDDLLDVSRILQGKLALKVSSVDLTTVIRSALETVQLAADVKQIQIQTHLTPNHAQVSGDAARLQQIVWNLLSNAVKFTPQGGQIQIRLEQIGQTAQIQVQDSGKGISPDFLPHVFDYFRQEDSKTTRKFGGLGLGLAIVRHLTELHGGTAGADSRGEDCGATFTIQLPLVHIASASEPGREPLMPTLSLSQVQILVVDDEPDMRNLAQFILEQQGARVVVVASAIEALKQFERQPPDVLISDIGMPDMDGYMLLQEIRQRSPEQGGRVPAIALTAYAGEYNEQQALRAGFQCHLPKPVEPEVLVEAIAKLGPVKR
jgi:PAS domain S-box-containing protein